MKRTGLVLGVLLASATASAAEVEVRMEKMQFVPAEIRIQAGDTVRWVNTEKRGYHTVWFQAEGMDESEPMFPGETWQRTFDKPGNHDYVCGPHPDMRARVIVE
jgi:plastocyanin